MSICIYIYIYIHVRVFVCLFYLYWSNKETKSVHKLSFCMVSLGQRHELIPAYARKPSKSRLQALCLGCVNIIRWGLVTDPLISKSGIINSTQS
jgi:hypothetical protein